MNTESRFSNWAGLLVLAISLASSLAGTWSDDFSRSPLGPDWTGDTNDFWIADGVLHGVSASPITVEPPAIVEVGNGWSNYVVSCSINIISPNTHVCTKGALVLRHSGNEGYVFALHEPTQTIELYRLSNHEMLLSKAASIKYKQWYRVRAEIEGNSISIWVNDVFIGSVTDNRSPSGSVGVAVQDADEALFDDFVVTGPNIPDNSPPATTTWLDNFNRESLGANWTGDTADFWITNNTLRGLSISGPVNVGPLNTLEVTNAWTNFVLSCSISLLRPELRECSKGALVLGHNGDETYVFALHEPTQTFELYRVSDHHMFFSRPATLAYSNYYQVRVEVQASTLSFLVNNAIIAEIPNTIAPTGTVGVAVQDAEVLFDDFMLTAPLNTEIRHFELNIGVQGRTLNFGLSEGAMITSGSWFLEMTHDFKSWERLVEFSPGNVAAFAQDTVPEGDFRPRFYRAILVDP